ncbi:uncharacterized protein LY89DRAFT_676003 [Mollisia scopiformis]|uniref:Uncharacterized protein n=1 Tax=Mollisia scopiformis TaxID=149040 RepID=A0A132BBR3_MOLSC|nr:uncharacterized protein LY89DRAFT_676003 [Mollisia scopiformis]KUJ09855.1 hypothetical protein LY89DRAFT_676003 [Mollisia scopiformis]
MPRELSAAGYILYNHHSSSTTIPERHTTAENVVQTAKEEVSSQIREVSFRLGRHSDVITQIVQYSAVTLLLLPDPTLEPGTDANLLQILLMLMLMLGKTVAGALSSWRAGGFLSSPLAQEPDVPAELDELARGSIQYVRFSVTCLSLGSSRIVFPSAAYYYPYIARRSNPHSDSDSDHEATRAREEERRRDETRRDEKRAAAQATRIISLPTRRYRRRYTVVDSSPIPFSVQAGEHKPEQKTLDAASSSQTARRDFTIACSSIPGGNIFFSGGGVERK